MRISNEQINRRLKSLETLNGGSIVSDILARGAYYDELTEEEREAYCKYRGTDQETIKTLYGYFYGDNLHFPCVKNPEPPTRQEQEEIIKEIHDYFEQRQEHDKSRVFETS